MNPADLIIKPTFIVGTSPKSVTVEDLTDWVGAGYTDSQIRWLFKNSGPRGVYYTNAGFDTKNFVAPNINGSSSMVSGNITGLPNDIDGFLLKGQYCFNGIVGIQYTLIGVDTATRHLTVSGTQAASVLLDLRANGWSFIIEGNADNNGVYTIDPAYTPNIQGGNTVFKVVEALTSNTAGGFFYANYTIENCFNFCFDIPKPNVSMVYDCAASTLTSRDLTDYSNGEIISRIHRISYPISLVGRPADIVASNKDDNQSVTVTPIATKTWVSQVTTDVLFTPDGGYLVSAIIKGAANQNVVCDAALCNIRLCMQTLFDLYANVLNSSPSRAAQIGIQCALFVNAWVAYQTALDCNDQDSCMKQMGIMVGILNKNNCNCSCGGDDDEVSRWITPLYGTLNPRLFNPANIITGVTPLVLNETNGVAVFTDNITSGAVAALVIINDNFVAAYQKVNLELQYTGYASGTDGQPVILGYNKVSGQLTVYVKNVGANTATSDISILFQLS